MSAKSQNLKDFEGSQNLRKFRNLDDLEHFEKNIYLEMYGNQSAEGLRTLTKTSSEPTVIHVTEPEPRIRKCELVHSCR